jgi:hypothetical protein
MTFAYKHHGKIVPVDNILGGRTMSIVRQVHRARAAILCRPKVDGPFRPADYERLSEWRSLGNEALDELRDILNDAESYWTGSPIYRRLPPRPGFGFRVFAPEGCLDLLVDLQNPGWQFFFEEEFVWGFNFAGLRLAKLAKSLFPELASPSRQSVWRRGAIQILQKHERFPYLGDTDIG